MLAKRPERVFPVTWQNDNEGGNFVIDIAIEAYDRKNLIRDITSLLSEEKVPILEMNSKSNKKKMTASVALTIETPNIDSMSRVMSKLESLPTIYSVQRV